MRLTSQTDRLILQFFKERNNEATHIMAINKAIGKSYTQTYRRIRYMHKKGFLEQLGQSPALYKIRFKKKGSEFFRCACPKCGTFRTIFKDALTASCTEKECLTKNGSRTRWWVNI